MQLVLWALQDNRLIINGEKCVWGAPELDYLGHRIFAAGVPPLPSNHPGVSPQLNSEGTPVFPRNGEFLHEIHEMSGTYPPPTHRQATWQQKGVGARGRGLCCCQAGLVGGHTFGTTEEGAVLSLVVDASAMHAGVYLQQQLQGKQVCQPFRFFSKNLETAQQKYSAFDSCLSATPGFATSDTCWKVVLSSSTQTTNR